MTKPYPVTAVNVHDFYAILSHAVFHGEIHKLFTIEAAYSGPGTQAINNRFGPEECVNTVDCARTIRNTIGVEKIILCRQISGNNYCQKEY